MNAIEFPVIKRSVSALRLPILIAFIWAACVLSGQAQVQGQPDAVLPAGVKAVWDVTDAFRETTSTRERICINGLWRWQPAADNAAEVPAAGLGLTTRCPRRWPGTQDYMQSDYQTLYPDPRLEAHQSERGPERVVSSALSPSRKDWAGRRIVLDVEYLNSYAEVYIDGRKLGVLRFPGGQVDLSAVVRPGATHVLSLLVVAMPLKAVMESYNDTNTAKQKKGSVERRGLCGDVWLIGEPAGARLSDVTIDTSVPPKPDHVRGQPAGAGPPTGATTARPDQRSRPPSSGVHRPGFHGGRGEGRPRDVRGVVEAAEAVGHQHAPEPV